MAGRNISVTHVALGVSRVIQTGGMMGEVIGMAASVCKKNNALPRDVYEKYFSELKSLMEKGIAPLVIVYFVFHVCAQRRKESNEHLYRIQLSI
jgi:hypothetical protein